MDQQNVINRIMELGRKHYRPEIDDLLDCIASDYSGYVNSRSFEDWASEYGYDTDSRQAEKIYNTVRQQAMDIESLIGRDQAELLAFEIERL